MILPKYLFQYACDIIEKKQEVVFNIKCNCGHRHFLFGKNQDVNVTNNVFDDYWKSFSVPIFSIGSAIDHKNGKEYYYGSTFFGIRIGKFYKEDLPKLDCHNIIKVRCTNCGEEFIVFDNYLYGYDSLDKRNKKIEILQEKDFLWNKKPFEMQIKILNDLTMEEFKETIEKNIETDEYSNLFSYIGVYKVINGRKTIYFEEETA